MSFDTRIEPKHQCARCGQRYHEYLKECPICSGERMWRDPKTLGIDQNDELSIDELFS